MPRDGSGIYTQPFPDVATDTTIESAVYNGFVADVATDMNTPRPVIAGGTGANNALDAMITLGGEIAEQLVTNYDSFPFETGSFRSAGSATAGPVDGHAFVGIVYKSDDNNLVLEARDQNDTAVPGVKYVREKKAGVWGAWASEDADTAAAIAGIAALDAAKVNRAGDTMTGLLYLAPATGPATLNLFAPGVATNQAMVNFSDNVSDIKFQLGKQTNNTLFLYDTVNADYVIYTSADGLNTTLGKKALVLADPVVPLGIATKQYVDAVRTYAAPLDALAYNGMQINGSMEVSQENGSATVGSNGFPADGWGLAFSAPSVLLNAARGGSLGIPGFPNHIMAYPTAPKPALAAGDFAVLKQVIEGYRIARLGWGTANAKPLTVAFWSSHQRAGIYSLTVTNGTSARSYAATYTHAVVGVPQYNVVTIPGDTVGTWASDNSTGLQINLTIACGTTYTAPSANTWLAGNYAAAPGQVNGVADTATDTVRFTSVVVLPGTEAPSAARSPFIMRPYDQELITCQRYWQKLDNIVVESSAVWQSWLLPTAMRAAPAIAGGGAGFTVYVNNGILIGASQTTRGVQTITLDARL